MRRNPWAKLFVLLFACGLIIVPFNATVSGQGQPPGLALHGMPGSGLPGVNRDASDIRAAPTVSTPGQIQEIPVRYTVDSTTLERLKANPPSLPGRRPVFVQDRSPLKTGQPSGPAPMAPTAVQSFDGQGFTGFIPPDNATTAGPNQVGQLVNSSEEVYQKSGAAVSGLALCGAGGIWSSTFFPPTGTTACGDPRAVYDSNSNRWVLVAQALSVSTTGSFQGSWYLIAATHTSDLTAGFCTWALDATVDGTTPTSNLADFPIVGIDSQAIYITSNQFSSTTDTFQYAKLRILSQTQVYNTTCPALTWVDFAGTGMTNADNTLADSIEPAQTYGTPGVEYLMNARSATGSDVTLWSLTSPLSSPMLSRVSVPVVGYSLPPNASQCTGATLIDTGDARLQQVVYRNGVLWTSHTVASGADPIVRFLRINPSGPTVLDDFAFGSTGVSYYYPAVTVDAYGNVYAVFNRSSATFPAPSGECAGVFYTGRPSADPANTMQSAVSLQAGSSSYVLLDPATSRNRWGDYSSSSPDPLNLKAVWIGGEYAIVPAGLCLQLLTPTGCWATKIAQLHFHVDTAGLYNPAAGAFLMRNANNGGVADLAFGYGPTGSAGWIPIVGDWNGTGTQKAGLYNPVTSTFFLRNSNASGPANLTFTYGPAPSTWLPVVGDWTGKGYDSVGLYNPLTSTFFLRNSNTSGPADLTFTYGPAGAGWLPVVGDWTGKHSDSVGLYNPFTSTFFLKNTNTSGAADIVFGYGPVVSPAWTPIVGDWNATGFDKVGLYNPVTSAFFLRDTNASGPADLTFGYGPGGLGWLPIVGDWSVGGF